MLICLRVGECRSRRDCKFSDSPTAKPTGNSEAICQFLCRCLSENLPPSLHPLLLFPFSFFRFVFLRPASYCLYVIVHGDLLRIRDRKPIYRGYLQEVRPFVCCEIETTSSPSSPTLTPSLPQPLSLSLSRRGHNSSMTAGR